MGSATFTQNYIASSIEQQSSLWDKTINGQTYKVYSFSRPENMSGYWNTRGMMSFGMPLNFIKSNLNFNAGISYTQTPSRINGELNKAKVVGYNAGVVLGSNISENVDFTLSWNGTLNNAKYTLQPNNNNKYFNQSASANLKLVMWAGITLTANATYNQYKGITDNYNEQYTIINAFLGKKLFKGNRGEVIVGVNDILNQNKDFSRNVTANYIENVRNWAIGRYYSVQFVYNLRRFGKKGSTDIADYQEMDGSSRMPQGRHHGGMRM